MSNYDDAKSQDHKIRIEVTNPVNTDKLKAEARDFKENIVGIARNIKEGSSDRAQVATDYIRDRLHDLKSASNDTLDKVETRIKNKPTQSVAIAFATGLVLSYLLGRRSN
jgi:ElaB/YqjD/DUF883 family membrane-anchored ribosome-binding protein